MSILRAITRPSIRKYTVLLCVGYLLIVFVFHSRLQFGASTAAQDEDDLLSDNELLKKALGSVSTMSMMSTNMAVANLALAKTTQPSKGQLRSVPRMLNLSLVNETHKRIQGTLFDDDADAQTACEGPRAERAHEFRLIVPGVFVYSAFWDDRTNDFDNEYGGVKVRFMVTISGKNYRPVMQCLWTVSGAERTTLVTFYEMCENHNQRWGGYILSCEVPSELESRPPCLMRITGKHSKPPRTVAQVPLTQIDQRGTRYPFAMCVPPLFGNVSSARLVEFVELSLMLGVKHIMVYNFRVTAMVNRTLQHYARQGLLTLLPWMLPGPVDKATWYHGQIVAIQDCLWRHMGRADLVSFNDIDEFIVPHNGTTWSHMVRSIDSVAVCGFKFQSAFFNPRAPPLRPRTAGTSLLPGLLTSANQRSRMLSRVRTKCMVKPRSIFEMGIHHISKPIVATLGGVNVAPAVAVLHHYRPCLSGFGMVCRDLTQDDSALLYGPPLYSRMKNALAHIETGHVIPPR